MKVNNDGTVTLSTKQFKVLAGGWMSALGFIGVSNTPEAIAQRLDIGLALANIPEPITDADITNPELFNE